MKTIEIRVTLKALKVRLLGRLMASKLGKTEQDSLAARIRRAPNTTALVRYVLTNYPDVFPDTVFLG